MSDLEEFYGPNAGYVLDLYERYQQDPASVDPATRDTFHEWNPIIPPPTYRNGNGTHAAPLFTSEPQAVPPVDVMKTVDVMKIVGAARVTRMVRELGHLTAHIDPLGSEPLGDPGLELATYGLTNDDLAALPASVVGGPLAEGAANALEALDRLRQAYSGSIGYEDGHIQNPEEREWVRDAAESRRFFQDFSDDDKRAVLQRLTEVESLEKFLHTTFVGAKRFSIEGVDALVPMLDRVVREASLSHTHEVVIGMAHRGRLNVLAHMLGKPYSVIMQEFKSSKQDDSASVAGGSQQGYSGDVIYHGGARLDFSDNGVEQMPITLTPNPSHLEFVDPVVEGRARAAQEQRKQPGQPVQNPQASLAIMIHGDAAFPGQGVVSETLNMSQLPGYSVGGTIHIITNNQIGFTTNPRDSRSTLYASDLAKGFEIPVVHVNADDAEACVAVGRMAFAYREKFGKDFLVDLVGYRRWGHNEGEEPSYTQPRLYEVVKAHPTAREVWANALQRQGVVTQDEARAMVTSVMQRLADARTMPSGKGLQKGLPTPENLAEIAKDFKTNVPAERLTALNESLLARPEGFTANAKLERLILQPRRTALTTENGIRWAHAEALAFASILADGTPIRLSGQDSQAGTFSQRHAVLHDPTTGETCCPLQALPEAKASFAVYNSPLSENSVLGFEYGYSIHATGCLVLWEAQFGDFGNGAQVIIDQFIASGNVKWQQTPSLVLLLPHGYEGQGPEHSSARLERYLQLAANGNMWIVYCTTAAQYFHVLRRQAAMLWDIPRPLVLMTPKGLLKVDKPPVGSSLSDLAEGAFQPLLDDPRPRDRAEGVTRLILCTGKVYVDMAGREDYAAAAHIAVVRIEELYPFPYPEMKEMLAGYPNLREVVWLQEEPRNMGAWVFISSRVREILPPGIALTYVGRPKSASPSEGSSRRHAVEQNRILSAALSETPKPALNGAKSKRSALFMPAEIRVPQMGESVTEATILRWLKKEGDAVTSGESIAELETDKVNVEVPADSSGIIQSLAHAEGDTVAVGDVLAVISDAAAPAAGSSAEPAPTPPPNGEGAGRNGESAPAPAASPLARTLADEAKVNLSLVKGTGPAGRITKDDVANYIEQSSGAPATANVLAAQTASVQADERSRERAAEYDTPLQTSPPQPLPQKEKGKLSDSPLPPGEGVGGKVRPEERVRMTRRRQTIATRLVETQATAAMLTTFNEIDMSAVMAIRAKRKDTFKEKNGIGLGFMSFFTKATIGALKAFPLLNAEIQGQEIVKKGYYDIGIAVGAEEGLVVPVVRDADQKTFAGIEKTIADLAKRARENTLTLPELQGGTFTITNGGIFGSMMSTPILNGPQVGILGLHKIEPRPIALNGEVVIKPMMYVALSYDHRIVDGGEAVRFLVKIKELIEDPEALLLEG